MKTFIIINGKSVRTIKAESMEQAVTRAENTCDHSKEIIVREIETEVKIFPNGFDTWQETHYDVSAYISLKLLEETEPNKCTSTIESRGQGGIYELAEELTNNFELENKGETWEENNYFDTIDNFLNRNLISMQ
jgi:hypothetical protein